MRVAGGIPVCSTESMLLAWVTLADLSDLDIVETHRHIVDKMLSGSSLVLSRQSPDQVYRESVPPGEDEPL
jgi:hypothetical protein